MNRLPEGTPAREDGERPSLTDFCKWRLWRDFAET